MTRIRFDNGDDPGHEHLAPMGGLSTPGQRLAGFLFPHDNDGWPDVLVTQYLGVKLFLNNGNGTFSDITEKAGLSNPHWGTSAAFLDYDRDGWLDLILVVYVDYDSTTACRNPSGERDYCAPASFHGRVSKLYRNLGVRAAEQTREKDPSKAGPPLVRFEDTSATSGIGLIPGPGLGVVCDDFDGDGWTDIFIANDGKANHLWINQKNGTFKEEGGRRGVGVNAMGNAEANMGIGWGDVNGDLMQDIFVTHLSNETNTLWRQWSPGMFRDATAFSALNRPRWSGTGFGTVLADFNQDGHLDVAIANGRVSKNNAIFDAELGPFWSQYAERNQLFVNDGSGKFQDISTSNPALCGRYQIGRGLALADLDGDGALDLLVTTINGRARLLRNVAPNRGHWLMIRAWDGEHQRDALTADVIVRAGKKRWIRTINPGGSFLCSNDVRAHFGLGTVERIDAVEIHWPDGKREEFKDGDGDFQHGEVDCVLLLKQGQGEQAGRHFRQAMSEPIMEQMSQASFPQKSTQITRGRIIRLGVLMAAAAALWFLWYRQRAAEQPPQLPSIPLDEMEPPVKRTIEIGMERVRKNPRSAESWGFLGKSLLVHGCEKLAEECFARATQLDDCQPRWTYYLYLCLHLRDRQRPCRISSAP